MAELQSVMGAGSLQRTWCGSSDKVIPVCDGVEITIQYCPEAPELRRIVVRTPQSTYTFGDYPVTEGYDTADKIAQSRKDWQPARADDYWQPNVWQTQESPRGGVEFWRRGPDGSTISTWQPHDRVTGAYIGRSHQSSASPAILGFLTRRWKLSA